MSKIIRKKKSIPKALRMKLWEHEFGDTLNGDCFTCNRNVKVDDFQAGHIISEANGGQVTLSNLRVLCKPCNTSCGTMDLDCFKQLLETEEKRVVKKTPEEKKIKTEEQTKLIPHLLSSPAVGNLSNFMFGVHSRPMTCKF